MWLKHGKYLCSVQSPTFVPNAAQNLLQSAPGGILGTLLEPFGGHLGGLGSLLGTRVVDPVLESFFIRFGGPPPPPRIWGRRLKDLPLGLR